jgi:hypothetical protein
MGITNHVLAFDVGHGSKDGTGACVGNADGGAGDHPAGRVADHTADAARCVLRVRGESQGVQREDESDGNTAIHHQISRVEPGVNYNRRAASRQNIGVGCFRWQMATRIVKRDRHLRANDWERPDTLLPFCPSRIMLI